MKKLPAPDAEALYARLLEQLASDISKFDHAVHLIGIHSGGAWLAERLQADLRARSDTAPRMAPAAGFLDISFYRDDFERIGLHDQVQPSDIPFEVANQHLVLVDDVLYTGRTVRAAMNELFDYGRPASIRLAALIDRGGRELPIRADFLGGTHILSSSQNLVLSRRTDGGFHLHTEAARA